MSSLILLDVTLRDGGYLNRFNFSDEQISKVITAVDDCGIDYIEVGYRNGAISPFENVGITGMCPNEYLLQCQKIIKNAKIAVMAHCQNIDKEDLKSLKACGVSLLRLCIQKGEEQLAYELIAMAKDAGLLVSANFTHISQYEVDAIYQAIENVLPFEPSLIYLADSNGCIHPDKVSTVYAHCTKQYKIPFGYHAHDNIGLAQANALAAINAGAQYIDASLAGASRGVGNMRLELFIAYLHSINNYKYQLAPLIEASNFVRKSLPTCGYVSEDEFMRGIQNLSAKQVREHKGSKGK